MFTHNLFIRELMKSIVPITRFNRGEASKIFEEVNKTGVKVVLKNNVPVGVIVKPEKYEEMIESLEDFALYFGAENRMKNTLEENLLSNEQVMKSLNISEADLDDEDVEIEE